MKNTNRRDFIKKLGMAAALAPLAPTMLGAATKEEAEASRELSKAEVFAAMRDSRIPDGYRISVAEKRLLQKHLVESHEKGVMTPGLEYGVTIMLASVVGFIRWADINDRDELIMLTQRRVRKFWMESDPKQAAAQPLYAWRWLYQCAKSNLAVEARKLKERKAENANGVIVGRRANGDPIIYYPHLAMTVTTDGKGMRHVHDTKRP